MKVFPKGQVLIPVKLRKKYGIEIGDRIEIEQQADGIWLKPTKSQNKNEGEQNGCDYNFQRLV